jgi:ketosteroid isomerase-like protein
MTATATSTEATLALIARFEENFNGPNVDALMADMTEDCVFEHVAPAASSFGRFEGAAAVRALWESLPEHFPNAKLDVVDLFADGNRCASRWEVRWDGGFMRGVDIFTVRDGKVAEKLTYVTL